MAEDDRHLGCEREAIRAAASRWRRCLRVEHRASRDRWCRSGARRRAGFEGEDVLLQPDEDAAGGVAADAAVGDFRPGESAAEVFAPALRDRVAEEDEGVLLIGFLVTEKLTAFVPDFDEPVFVADGAEAGGGIG